MSHRPRRSSGLSRNPRRSTRHGTGTQDAVAGGDRTGDAVGVDVAGRIVEGLGVLEGEQLVVPVAVGTIVPVGGATVMRPSSSA